MQQQAAAVSTNTSYRPAPTAQDIETWRTDPDVALMEKVRADEPGAFDTLFHKHSAHVVKFAYQFLHSRERAEDMAQTVFLQLYRARHRYEPRARFLTYLYRITTNTCLNELRRREYATMISSLDTPPEHGQSDAPTPDSSIADTFSPDPHEEVSGHELAAEVHAAIERLPMNQRAAFLLGRVEGLPYRDIAENLDTSVSAVKSLIFRATSSLRDDLRVFLGGSDRSLSFLHN